MNQGDNPAQNSYTWGVRVTPLVMADISGEHRRHSLSGKTYLGD